MYLFSNFPGKGRECPISTITKPLGISIRTGNSNPNFNVFGTSIYTIRYDHSMTQNYLSFGNSKRMTAYYLPL